MARAWAEQFDANSLVILRKAMLRYNVEPELHRIEAQVLYVLSSTDNLFPPSLAPDVMAKLQAAGVQAEYFELQSAFGHLASGLDAEKWAPRTCRVPVQSAANLIPPHGAHRDTSPVCGIGRIA